MLTSKSENYLKLAFRARMRGHDVDYRVDPLTNQVRAVVVDQKIILHVSSGLVIVPDFLQARKSDGLVKDKLE